METFDLIVIGTGTAAQVTAGRVCKAGRSVAVVDLKAAMFAYPTGASDIGYML